MLPKIRSRTVRCGSLYWPAFMEKKTWIWTILIVGGVTAAIIAFVLWDEARVSKRLSQETEALGFAALPVHWEEDDKRVEGHTLTYAYMAGSQTFTQTLEKVTWYHPEWTYKVCVNPADPKDARLYRSTHVCGK